MKNDRILVSKEFNKEIPVIIIDFDNFNLIDAEDKRKAYEIVNNIESLNIDNKNVLVTCQNQEPINMVKQYNIMPDWNNKKGEEFIKYLKEKYSNNKVQLAGIYRELCIVEVAALIKKSSLNIEPIIIDNDKYSISAEYSVFEGDTLENRIDECGYKIKYNR